MRGPCKKGSYTNYNQEFQDKTIILLILTDNTKTKREIFKNLHERDSNYRNIVLSCSHGALIKIVEMRIFRRYIGT